ncbi:MAG: DUF5674 family protein [Nitrospira sp.]|nr:DUF5674 family protein [Nitrospira sp.]
MHETSGESAQLTTIPGIRNRVFRTLLCELVPTLEIIIVRDTISRATLRDVARRQFGDMVKAVVDTEAGIMAIGGELHSDEEAMLLDEGSRQSNLWGINLYPEQATEEWIEFDSMINVRPSEGNRSRHIESVKIRETVIQIVQRLVED